MESLTFFPTIGMIGGPGIMSGANYGPRYAIFEAATRNTGTKLAGTNSANPCAMISASADLLGHLGFDHHSNLIRDAIQKTINEDAVHTSDLSGQATTSEVVQNIIQHVKQNC